MGTATTGLQAPALALRTTLDSPRSSILRMLSERRTQTMFKRPPLVSPALERLPTEPTALHACLPRPDQLMLTSFTSSKFSFVDVNRLRKGLSIELTVE